MIIDMHIHTKPASACSDLDPAELIEEAKRIGLDGVCITEHDKIWAPEAIRELREKYDFLVLRGTEITSMDGDMLVFGLDREFDKIISVKELRGLVDEVDGVMIAAHPFRGAFLEGGEVSIPGVTLTVEEACKKPFLKFMDTVESLNGENSELEDEFTLKVCEGLNMKGTGGSDAHSAKEVGRAVTIFEMDINCEKDLIRELKAGRFRAEIFRR
ncbi:MAG: PHP domain-containing protein [Thermodesulfobacteriota bacterium]|nr:PHP domain-containing protein [Thermodesulfobacteriota bacterium]